MRGAAVAAVTAAALAVAAAHGRRARRACSPPSPRPSGSKARAAADRSGAGGSTRSGCPPTTIASTSRPTRAPTSPSSTAATPTGASSATTRSSPTPTTTATSSSGARRGCISGRTVTTATARHYAGGFGWLRLADGRAASTLYLDRPPASHFRRTFGAGYASKRMRFAGLQVTETTTAPFGDDPALVDEVRITNRSGKDRRFAWWEYWDVNPYDENADRPPRPRLPHLRRGRAAAERRPGADRPRLRPAVDLPRRRTGDEGLGLRRRHRRLLRRRLADTAGRGGRRSRQRRPGAAERRGGRRAGDVRACARRCICAPARR